MATISELTVQVLTARLAKRDMSLEELQNEIAVISRQLRDIETGTIQDPVSEVPVEEAKPLKINFKKIFKENEVVCLLCNKGFKTLKRHLNTVHQITDKEYRGQFGIPAKQPLVAKSYSEQKKAFALENKLGDKMQADRKSKSVVEVSAVSGAEATTAVPAVKNSTGPAVKAKAPGAIAKKAPPKTTK
jgi:predicted transcriptional regulator